MKMLLECRATHVLTVIWDADFDGDIHFKFGLRKGQCQVKLGQNRPIFEIQNFHAETCLSCSIFPLNSINIICFYVRKLEMPKIAFQKGDVITLTYLVFDH